MCISQHNPATGKVQTISDQPHNCSRCQIVERELSIMEARATTAESAARIFKIDLTLANARITQLETEIAAAWAARGIK